jgi:medium-chain acyl-[acyl-carrier-protein] hydrolase
MPFAGGGAFAFRPWARLLPPAIELVAVQLPGRESRLREHPIGELDLVLAGLLPALAQELEARPCAFFGYSMGALVAFEAARRLLASGRPGPSHFLVAASRAPQAPLPTGRRALHALPERDLLDELRTLGGTPRRVLEDRDMMEFFLPALRADLRITETYRSDDKPLLDVPIAAFAGRFDEHTPPARVAGWREQTRAGFAATTFDGGHFFLQSHRDELLAGIAAALHG